MAVAERSDDLAGLIRGYINARLWMATDPALPKALRQLASEYQERHKKVARGRAAHEHRGAADQTGQGHREDG